MIERLETAYYRLPLNAVRDAGHGSITEEELITVKLYAEGIAGHGYAYTIGRGGRAIQTLIEQDLAPMLVRQDPTKIPTLWDKMWRRMLYVGRGGLVSFAIAAVDIALWDLRGQWEEKPLYALLGGTSRAIPVYGSGVDLHLPQSALLRQMETFLNRGFRGVTMKVGHPDPEQDETRVAAVRRLIGDEVDLMLDANMAWTAYDALMRGRRLEPYNPFWLEEPTAPEDVAGHARLAEALRTPIAVGESLHSPQEFRHYVQEQAVEVVQVDPITNGGITACVKALAMADQAGLMTSSHYADELNAHLLCSSQRPVYLEKHAFSLNPYLETSQKILRGLVRPSEEPGTGLRFNEEALARYRA